MKQIGVPVSHGPERATAYIDIDSIETIEPLNERCSEVHMRSGHRVHIELSADRVATLIDGNP